MPNRQFILGQTAFMSSNKIAWRDIGADFVDGWLAAYDNDRRMDDIEGVPV